MVLDQEEYISTLKNNSHQRINVLCDYCDKEFTRSYSNYLKVNKNNILNKDFCKECIAIKNIELFLNKINSTQIEEIIALIKRNKGILSGVYSIREVNTNKSYIGSSKNIIGRWKSHIGEMNLKSHHVKIFNEIEIEQVEFIFLFEVEEDMLVNQEYKFIQMFKSYDKEYGFNYMRQKLNRNKGDLKNKRASEVAKKRSLSQSNLNEDEIKDIKTKLAQGIQIKEVLRLYDNKTTYSNIQSIKATRIWRHILPELNETLINIEYKDTSKGENNSSAKLTEQAVKSIKRELLFGEKTIQSIADENGVSRVAVSRINTGKAWSYVKIDELEEQHFPIRNNPNHSKLQKDDVIIIKKLINEDSMTLTDIGKLFGVNRTAISSIKRGRTWSNI